MDELTREQTERQFIRFILLNPDSIHESKVRPEDIYDPNIQRIFKAALEILNKGNDVDKNELLATDGKIDPGAFKPILNTKINPKNFDAYQQRIIEFSKLRELKVLAQTIMDEISSGSNYFSILNSVYKLLDEMDSDIIDDDISPAELEAQFMRDVLARDHKTKGLLTHLDKINRHTGGFMPGEFIVIGAFTNDGKSALMMNFAATMASKGNSIGIITLEDPDTKYRDRMLSFFSGINYSYIKNRDVDFLSDEQNNALLEAQKKFKNLPLVFSYKPGMTIGEIEAKARIWVKKYGIKALIVDYIQIIQNPGFKNLREQTINTVLRLTSICRNLGIVLITSSQINREGAKKPTLSNLSESAQIAHNADYIFLIEASDGTLHGEKARIPEKIVLAKARDAPKGLTVPIAFQPNRLKFAEKVYNHEN